jgi:hypothetical protein
MVLVSFSRFVTDVKVARVMYLSPGVVLDVTKVNMMDFTL